MTVIVLSGCPPSIRGYLSRWMIEIAAGVYVGTLSARVREELWKKITYTIGEGNAAMVLRKNNEQGLEIRLYNTDRTLENYDGIWLVRKPKKHHNQPPKNDNI